MAEPMTDYDAAVAAAQAMRMAARSAAITAYRLAIAEADTEFRRTCAAAAMDDATGTALSDGDAS